jgi:uncharacterized membrane protein
MSSAAVKHPRAHRAFEFTKTTLVAGLVFLVPFVILAVVVVKVGGLLHRLAQPLADLLPVNTIYGVVVVDVIAGVLLVLGCFLGGLLARFSFASRLVRQAESGVLLRIPGYAFLKGWTDSLEKGAAATGMRPVLVHFDDYAQLAFEVERLDDGRRVVYLPSAPNPRAGSVVVVDGDRVEPVPITFIAATRKLRELGRGLGQSLRPQAR